MNIKLRSLFVAKASLEKILNQDLPIKLSFKLSQFAKKAHEQLSELDEQRIKLIKKYGENDSEGNLKVKDSNLKSFADEYNELLDMEVDGLNVPIIKMEDLESNSELKLSAIDLVNLEPFISE